RGGVRTWKLENRGRILVDAGCGTTLWGESLKKKFPLVDWVSPATEIERFPEAVAQVLKGRWNWDVETKTTFGMNDVSPNAVRPNDVPGQTPSLFGNERTAYITIMRGCNLNCSYCIVPQVRGREKYRAMPEILNEIHDK